MWVTETSGRRSAAAIVAALALLAPAAGAAEALRFSPGDARRWFNAYGCNACHAVDEVRLGPPYRHIAARYGGEVSAALVERLAMKIVHGGAGAWGYVPMVSNPRVAPEEARGVARWILALPSTPPP